MSPPADAKGLSNPGEVEVLREKVYAALESYCKQKYPEQQGRWAPRNTPTPKPPRRHPKTPPKPPVPQK